MEKSQVFYDIKSPGVILFDNNDQCYIDQLDLNGDIKVPYRRIRKYLLDEYELTLEQYYNLVVHGDKYRKETCPVCGRVLEFDSLLHPYYMSCSECRKQYNFQTNGEQLQYCKDMYLPTNMNADDLREFAKIRIKFLANHLKLTGDQSDALIKLLRKDGVIRRDIVDKLISRDQVNPSYSDRTNLYNYLINKGFHHYEIQYIIKSV